MTLIKNITFKDISEQNINADILIIPLFENPPSEIYADLDALIGGIIKRVIESKEFTGKSKQLLRLHVNNIGVGRIILLGLGDKSKVSAETLRRAGSKVFAYIEGLNITHAALSTRVFKDLNISKAKHSPLYYFFEGGFLSIYNFVKFKSEKISEDKKDFEDITILADSNTDSNNLQIKDIQTIVSATFLARDLANTPSNEMTPTTLSETALDMANNRIKVKVLNRTEAQREGMGAYVAVSMGSNEPSKFIIIEYSGGEGVNKSPIALIGKAITFDSGGISIKPAQGMEQMKYDMSGGAAVLAAIKAADILSLPINIIGILPATENLSGGSATRPGDIVKSITGKTIEIINTDAEGRLILADGIGYAIKHYKPRYILDIATLTGACSVALGNEAIAMMGNDSGLMEMVKRASEETHERVWQMPLYSEFAEYLKSDAADIKNSGGKDGSLLTAAWFLKEFAGATKWVHLDIASTAWSTKDKNYIKKGATGIGTRLLIEFLTIASNT